MKSQQTTDAADEITIEKPKLEGPRSLSLGHDVAEAKLRYNKKGSNTTADDENQSLLSGGRRKVPEDKGGVAYLMMILFGIGVLLPWNAVLTSLDFFEGKVSVIITLLLRYKMAR